MFIFYKIDRLLLKRFLYITQTPPTDRPTDQPICQPSIQSRIPISFEPKSENV
jgi:hypothetical protein